MKHIIIIPVGIIPACESVAWTLGIQEAGKRVLCVDLVPADGDADAVSTHAAGEGKLGLTDEEIETRRVALEQGFEGGSFPGARWWRMDDQSILLASHNQESETQLGNVWDFEKAISAAGLQRRLENSL
jgi:hypothetical protein